MTFDNWFPQPAFGRFLDQALKLPYVAPGAVDEIIETVLIKPGQAVTPYLPEPTNG